MMRDGGNDAQELNISRHPNMKDAPGRGGLQIDPLRTMPPGPPRVTNLLLGGGQPNLCQFHTQISKSALA